MSRKQPIPPSPVEGHIDIDALWDEDGNPILADIATQLRRIAGAITPIGTIPGTDATGGTVDSLTEAVMGISAGLVQIAEALHAVAEVLGR